MGGETTNELYVLLSTEPNAEETARLATRRVYLWIAGAARYILYLAAGLMGSAP